MWDLGFVWNVGISNCKILAKLASGMHKPSQQTVVPAGAVTSLLEELPIPKLRQLGGKLGDEVMRVLNIKTVGKLFPHHYCLLSSPLSLSKFRRKTHRRHARDSSNSHIYIHKPQDSRSAILSLHHLVAGPERRFKGKIQMLVITESQLHLETRLSILPLYLDW